MGIKAVIVFDPKAEKQQISGLAEEEALAESRLLFYYATCHVEPSERRSQASLIQGAFEFTKFVKNEKDDKRSSEFKIETDQLLFTVRELDENIYIALVVERAKLNESVTSLILDRLISYYFLLHGSVREQLAQGFALSTTMDDFIPCFVASETITSGVPVSIRYAPVEAHALVAVHSLGLELLSEFRDSGILDFAIMYRGYLVSSSMEPDVLAPLYSYLVMNSSTGEVSNVKLLRPPYGRIGTPAIALGGGSSAFGRSNFFDADNASNGFLFGPTGGGEAVFSPKVFLKGETNTSVSSGYLLAYILNGVMVAVITRESPEYVLSKRIETFLVDNHELNEETLSLLRADFAKHLLNAHVKENFDFVYLNKVSKSLIPFNSSSGKKDFKRGTSFFSSRFVYPFGGGAHAQNSASQTAREQAIDSRIAATVTENPDIASLALKASSDDGWKVFMRKGHEREMKFDFKDPKLPLWKVNADIAHFLKVRFESVVL
jgi:hypothetical protein